MRNNRHARKRQSRRKDRKRFLTNKWIGGSKYASWNDYKAHQPAWGALVRPWQFYSIAGSRANYYRQQASRSLRRAFRTTILYQEDCYLPQRGQYKKCYDYTWNVW